MVAPRELDAPSDTFALALEQFRAARLRPEVVCEEMPAPQRIAPFSAALSADVVLDGSDLATGRIVLLHDPAGIDAWHGTFRCVAYTRADIEPEMVTDAAVSGVAWSWLCEALARCDADYTSPSGTVTRVASESFGGMAEDPATAQIEIRASWTPGGDLRNHVEAWGQLLCTAAGLPPVSPGVVAMPSRRGPRAR